MDPVVIETDASEPITDSGDSGDFSFGAGGIASEGPPVDGGALTSDTQLCVGVDDTLSIDPLISLGASDDTDADAGGGTGLTRGGNSALDAMLDSDSGGSREASRPRDGRERACSSRVTLSTSIPDSTPLLSVGRCAMIVNWTSSWFCWKRLRKLR